MDIDNILENIFGWGFFLIIAYFGIGLAIAQWGWQALWRIPKAIGLALVAWILTDLIKLALFSLPCGIGWLYWLIVKTPQMQ